MAPVLKRRGGPPPKRSRESISSKEAHGTAYLLGEPSREGIVDLECSLTDTIDAPVGSLLKRKRGRPPKRSAECVNATYLAELEEADHSFEEPSVGGVLELESCDTSAPVDTAEIPAATQLKRKRGRPPRRLARSLRNDSVDKTESVGTAGEPKTSALKPGPSLQAQPKRRRGRTAQSQLQPQALDHRISESKEQSKELDRISNDLSVEPSTHGGRRSARLKLTRKSYCDVYVKEDEDSCEDVAAKVPKTTELDSSESLPVKRRIGRPTKAKGLSKTAAGDNAKTSETDDPNAEPAICTRCGNVPAGMGHFYRLHNGLLAEEENTFSAAEKRKQWNYTERTKKCRLRCQQPNCGKIINSVTGMAYHNATCGVSVEKSACPMCERVIAVSYLRQHIDQHNRGLGVYQRNSKYSALAGPEVFATTEPDIPQEAEQSSVGRKKRQSAVAAARKLQEARADSEEKVHQSDDEKYQPSETGTKEDDDEEEGDPEDTSYSVLARETCRRLTFVATQRFPRVDRFWMQSLDVLGYARCEISGCDFMTTTLTDINLHHRTCVNRTRRVAPLDTRLTCDVTGCKFRCTKPPALIKHYCRVHGYELERAKAMPHLTKKRSGLADWEPTPEEIDALELFS